MRDGIGSKLKMNMNVDGDRLSNLSDNLIHKIFSSISTKEVVQMSVLSSRWRFIWTSIPYLNISTEDFSTLPQFSEFVTHVMSRHNNKIDESSVNITLYDHFLKDIMEYALSPRSLFWFTVLQSPSCRSVPSIQNPRGKSIWELPALTKLYLQYVDLSNDDINSLFSKCANLKNLTLERCGIVGSGKKISICHPRLSILTLDDSFVGKHVNVIAPKLENLTIIYYSGREYFITISAPDLTSFVYRGQYSSLRLSTDGLNSLKKAEIYVWYLSDHHLPDILSLLQHIHSVKFLTLDMKIIEFLSSCVELILHQPFVFTNFKRLKIHRNDTRYKSFYLDSFPGVALEEIVAQSIVLEFSLLLEQEKTDTKTSMTRMERENDPMEIHREKILGQGKSQAETKLHIGESVTATIESCLRWLYAEIRQRKSRYRLIISKLQKIEEVLAKLPASKTALIQPSLASLSAEAVIVMGEITNLIKTQCDEKESQISGCIHSRTCYNIY